MSAPTRRPRGLVRLSETTTDGIDIYAIGVLHELGFAYNLARHGRYRNAWDRLRRIPGFWDRRSSWNGYLAEPLDPTIRITRAGTGWTRRRAAADLRRHITQEAQR
ncbi:hypothetical protein [Nocardia asiatica]|uniref:hypothetical protein n=1 Tax=Nocardia asiatica TaxID=209252 RepID=UPI002458F4D5|nr:hypothetical protein [Nocardia asiatica]